MPSFRSLSAKLQDQIVGPIAGTPEREKWLQGDGALELLRSTQSQDVPVLAVTPTFYLCSVLVPADKIPSDLRAVSVNWYCDPSRVWNIDAWRDRRSSEASVDLYPPSTVTGAGKFDNAESIAFLRQLPRGLGKYIEASQSLYQSAGLHRMDERNAYSRLNRNGDFEDIIRYGEIAGGHLCTVEAATLDQYMQATNLVLLRFFQVDQLVNSSVWSTHEYEVESFKEVGISGEVYRLRLDGQIGGTRLHGLQIIQSFGDRQENLRLLLGEDEQSLRKATFIIPGGKGQTTQVWPPARAEEKEGLSSLIVPAYFSPEVLTKYKTDPEKYRVTLSTVECFDTWFLRSYDVNSEGQVYAYLKDLYVLPHSEQQYWASFNEAPKAGITERSWMQDFEAKWWPGHDALHELAQLLHSFPAPKVQGELIRLWTSAGPDRLGESAIVRLHRPLTEAREDWARHVLDLEKVIVEGFVKGLLIKLAKALGIDVTTDEVKAEQSLKLLARILRRQGVEEETVEKICGPLGEIHYWRSHGGIGHRGGKRPDGDLRTHYNDLVDRTFNAMKTLADLIESGVLDVPENGISAA